MLDLREDGYITARAAATATGHAIQTIYRWCYSGKLVGKKVNDWWYVKAENLVDLFDGAPEVQAKIRQALYES